jgi:hypothetical protein
LLARLTKLRNTSESIVWHSRGTDGAQFGAQSRLTAVTQNSEETLMSKIENLKPWQPGRSGNPGGRPKKKPVTDLYAQMLEDGATQAMVRKAIQGVIRKGGRAFILWLKEVADRTEGKVTQSLAAEIAGPNGDAAGIEVRFVSPDAVDARIQELLRQNPHLLDGLGDERS